MEVLVLSLAGFVAGFVDAIAGGGGVITYPALILMGLPITQVAGTSKLVSASGTTAAAYTFLRKGFVQKEVVAAGLPFTFLGALAGAVMVLVIPNEFLKPLISVLVIIVAVYCYVRPTLGAEHGFKEFTPRAQFLTRAAALGIGFYDGFCGPGTGIFLTFFFVKALHCDFLRATANTKVLNWMSNIVPLTYFLIQGTVRFDLGIPMVIANIAGGYCGAHAAIAKGSKFVKWIYLVMAVLTAAKLCVDLAAR